MNIIFFGSTSDSVIVLSRLVDNNYFPVAVVTQPPTPIGRKQIITPTPVEIWAKKHTIPITSFGNDPKKPWLFQNEEDVVNTLLTFKPNLLISACYGVKIPQQILKKAKFKGLNIHPSLLPRWRGADPVPWTILSGDQQTGVSVVTLVEQFDQGRIIAQKKIAIRQTEVSDRLRATLFSLGADLLINSLPNYLSGSNKGTEQKSDNGSVAKKLTREDGFIPWDHLKAAMEGSDIPQKQRIGISQFVTCHMSHVALRMLRALSPWPGVWTRLASTSQRESRRAEKRLKIIEAHLENNSLILDTVQLEGKKPVSWKQFGKAYL
ncbi:methionyl-tRNA formyltransferase [Patescibacteria group bacterium]|nr:methionyl-tRNA formyltransferase [Patescibacteria group bacterium]